MGGSYRAACYWARQAGIDCWVLPQPGRQLPRKPCLTPVVSITQCSSPVAWVRPVLLAVDTAVGRAQDFVGRITWCCKLTAKACPPLLAVDSAICCAAAWSANMTEATHHQHAALPRLQEVQEEELQRQRELVQQARAQLKEEAAVKAAPAARQQPSMAIRWGGRGI